MDRALALRLIEVAEDTEIEAEIREGYSGRGMYGKETTAVVAPSLRVLLEMVIENADMFSTIAIDRHEEQELFLSPRAIFENISLSADSMGRDQIIIY